jgi:hypothetical protein
MDHGVVGRLTDSADHGSIANRRFCAGLTTGPLLFADCYWPVQVGPCSQKRPTSALAKGQRPIANRYSIVNVPQTARDRRRWAVLPLRLPAKCLSAKREKPTVRSPCADGKPILWAALSWRANARLWGSVDSVVSGDWALAIGYWRLAFGFWQLAIGLLVVGLPLAIDFWLITNR